MLISPLLLSTSFFSLSLFYLTVCTYPSFSGQSGHCRMFIWDETSPNRDGAMENDIPLHEMTHGLTNRMTGGGTGRCLQTTEAGGMGEGWSDTMSK